MKELERENAKLKRLVAELSLEKQILKDVASGNFLSPERRRCCGGACAPRRVRSERAPCTCRLLGQWRRTQRYAANPKIDEEALTEAIIALASEYGRYGYRRITALLQRDGWQVGKDRVQRIWRREGLKVPQKQRPRRRLWLNDGSCVRLRPERANHVWSYDFVSAMTHDGRTLRMLTLIDEYTRESLAIRVARRLGRYEVIEALADVMLFRGIAENIRSDNGPEFVAKELRQWLAKAGDRDAVHRTRQSLGERLLRELQREVAG